MREITLREYSVAEARRVFGQPPTPHVGAISTFPVPCSPPGTEQKGTRIRNRLDFRSLQELFALPPEEHAYLVADLLPMSGSSLLAAKPKVGKSTLGRNLTFCISKGEEFFWLPVTPGRVLYLALEEKATEVVDHFRRLGATGAEPIEIHVGSAPREGLQQLEQDILRVRPVLVVIDPLLKFIRVENANDYAEISGALEPLTDLARHSGCHIMAIHHLNKIGGVLGSIAIEGAVDTILEMDREGDQRTIKAEAIRYGKPLERSVLAFERDTGRMQLSGTVAEVALREVEERLIRFIQENPGSTEKEITDVVPGKTERTRSALRKLLVGVPPLVKRDGRGVKNGEYRYFIY